MAGVNKVIIIGHLGADPDVRTMPDGTPVANFSVATSESWKDKNTGEQRTQTEWHRIVLFNRQAEIAGQYLHKGSKVYIEGKLKTRKWTDQNGIERYTTEIQGHTLQMLDGKADSQSGAQANTQAPKNNAYAKAKGNAEKPILAHDETDPFTDDDIPF